MEERMEGDAPPAQLGTFFFALGLNGETPEDVTGMSA